MKKERTTKCSLESASTFIRSQLEGAKKKNDNLKLQVQTMEYKAYRREIKVA